DPFCYPFFDFQYLATHNDADGNQMSLYDKIILRKPEKKEFYDSPVPLFLPPPIFSHLDTAVCYYYCPDVLHRETAVQPVLLKDHLSAPNRARRPNNAIFVNFDDKTIPTEPLEAAVMSSKKICVHPNDVKAEQQLRQLFERRHIWSRNAVKANINIHPEKMKHLFPYVAYYMVILQGQKCSCQYRYFTIKKFFVFRNVNNFFPSSVLIITTKKCIHFHDFNPLNSSLFT
uniref:General transcription factor IIIC, polypeptide 5 n=1 Tax=Cyprinus carpio TaxID=7962 RepID=A0A8C1RLT0_CYPCA